MNDEIEVVITTAAFRDGQAAALADARRDPESTPNEALLRRLDPEFAAGYRYEWREYIEAFARAQQILRAADCRYCQRYRRACGRPHE